MIFIKSKGLIMRKLSFVVEEFQPQTNGEIADSIVQNWTEQAVECYSLNGDCSKCSIQCHRYSFKCQMAKVVKVLLQKIGLPQANFI